MPKIADEIRQKPITDSMTAEQKHEYDANVHEAQYGNTKNFWDVIPVSGFSGKVDPKPMSDDLEYESERINHEIQQREDADILEGKQNKSKQVEKWIKSIEKLTRQIEIIQADKSISTADKQRKIAKRQEIIDGYKRDIENAITQKAATVAMYERYMKIK